MKLRALESYSDKPKNYMGLFLFLMILGFSGGLLGNYLIRNTIINRDSLADATETITVCPEPIGDQVGCNYYGGDGIQTAINEADGDGETILIRNGNYSRQSFNEMITGDNKRIKCFISTNENGADKNLVIKGDGNTILKGLDSAAMNAICAKGNTVTIQNLTIDGFKADPASCFVTEHSSPCSNGTAIMLIGNVNASIKNNFILNNAGNAIDGRFNAVLNNFKNNIILTNKIGVSLTNSAQMQSLNNTIYNNLHGFECMGESRCMVKNTIVVNNTAFGLKAETSNNFPEIKYNLVFNNTADNYDDVISEGTIINGNNISLNPGFVSTVTNDFHLSANSPAINSGDTAIVDPDNSRSDIGGYGGNEACGLDRNLPGCNAQVSPTPVSPAPISPTPCTTQPAVTTTITPTPMPSVTNLPTLSPTAASTPNSVGDESPTPTQQTTIIPTTTVIPTSTTIVTPTANPCQQATPTPPVICSGISDIDCNGTTNIRDFSKFVQAVKLQRSGYTGLPQTFQLRSDINNDGLVNITDFIPFKEVYVDAIEN